jgi:small-conductance mechanosensitive channel
VDLQRLWELLTDNETILGRAVTSGVAVTIAVLVALSLGAVAARRSDDPATSFYVRKAVRYVIGTLTVIALLIYWQPFGGRVATVVGLATAGIAFAMQEVIGALAGFVNILTGRIFRIGDRIQLGGVHGDVIDITPLRTRLMEIGSPADSSSWVQGRQHTGRVVAVSNKATFTQPVYNYSSLFDFIWEELTIPVAHHSDWRRAETIMREESERISRSVAAQRAMADMRRRFPVPDSELQPRVFVRATDNWMELAARFVVSTRTARGSKDELTRRIHDRLAADGIDVASTTMDVTLDTD